MPPIGRLVEAAEPAWRAAGHDVPHAILLARERVTDDRRDGWAWVQLFEALRRAGQPAAAGVALGELRACAARSSELSIIGSFAAGLLPWWTPRAAFHYEAVARAGATLGDPVCEAVGLLGIARSSRFSIAERRPDLAEEAIRLAGEDAACLADGYRERAAHAILEDDPGRALELSDAALTIHVAMGDDVLAAAATLLRGRIERDGLGDRLATLRRAHSMAIGAGALDLASDAALFLAPALARAATPDQAAWHEALALTESTLNFKQSYDPFGVAECRLQLASLLSLTDSRRAEQAARSALEYFTTIGNQLGIANSWKALARIHLVAARMMWQGSWFRASASSPANIARGAAEMGRARAGYIRSHLPLIAARTDLETALVRTYRDGLVIDAAQLEAMATGVGLGDDVNAAKMSLILGLRELERRPKRAVRHFRSAIERADRFGSPQLVTIGHAALTEAYRRSKRPLRAAESAAQFVAMAEQIRTAIPTAAVALDLAEVARDPYRYALRIAIEAHDGSLAVRAMEGLRSERLTSLFRQATGALKPTDAIEQITVALADVDRALQQAGRNPNMRGEAGLLRPELADGDVDEPLHPTESGDLVRRRAELFAELRDATNEAFAALYSPASIEFSDVLAAIDPHEHVLVLLETDEREAGVVAAWRPPHGAWHVAEVAIAPAAVRLLDALVARESGARRQLHVSDLRPLAMLLPAPLVESIVGEHARSRLRIVPSGRLWAVPFLALAVRDELLVEQAEVVLTPSLRLHAAARAGAHAAVSSAVTPRMPRALSWHSSELAETSIELDPFVSRGALRAAADASDFLAGLSDNDITIAVATAHGNSNPGLAHALTVGGRPVLSAAQMLAVRCCADVVILAACHGLFAPGSSDDEPLGLPTAALTAGAGAVIGSHFELATDGATSHALMVVYQRLLSGDPAPSAVANAVAELLVASRLERDAPITQWPALNVVGIGPTASA